MAKGEKIYWFSFSLGPQSSWGLDMTNANDRGLFHPRFSSITAVPQGNYPDIGLPEGRYPALGYGEFLPPEFAKKLKNPIPAHNLNVRNRGKLPVDIAALGDGSFSRQPIVSSRFKAVIEAVEPGKHQYIPVTFVNGDLDVPEPVWSDTEWYYFNLLNWVEPDRFFNVEAMGSAITRAQLPVAYGRSDRVRIQFPTSINKDFIVRREFVQEKCQGSKLFVTSEYLTEDLSIVRVDPGFYCTDGMRAAFKDAGLKGGHFFELRMI